MSNDVINWSLDFGPDSVTLTVEDFVQEMTKCSQDSHLAASSLLLSQTEELLNNHLAQVLVTLNQQGTHEVKSELLSSARSQGKDISGYQVSDLDDVEIYWENDQQEKDVDAVFTTGIHTLFSGTMCDDLQKGVYAENSILLVEDDDRGELSFNNTSLWSLWSLWETITTPALLRSHPFRTRTEKLLIVFRENCFNKYYRVCVLSRKCEKRVSFHHNRFLKN